MSPTAKKRSDQVTVHVPEDAGDEIRLSIAGDDPLVFAVENRTVKVDAELVPHVLANVDGSTVGSGNPAAANQE